MTTRSLRAAARATLSTPEGDLTYFRLGLIEEQGLAHLQRLPFSIRVLLENALRNATGELVSDEDVRNVAAWTPTATAQREFPYMPARVLMQDFTGVPAVVDLAAMRSAIARRGGDPRKVNPLVPVDLVIDHSVQVDHFGTPGAFQLNVQKEFERNGERYALLRWAQKAFQNFTVVPPGTGIIHQVNLEYLSRVIYVRQTPEGLVAYPETQVGTDSHTTMINGLSVLAWGVGGIEAEAVMLGQPYYMPLPEVIGVKLTGALREGVTATDLVLTVTNLLRRKGVVEKFVEFYGTGLSHLPLPDRATIANMAPEYGATCGFFPIDQITLDYLWGSGREPAHVEAVHLYAQAQGLFRTDDTPEPEYTGTLALDLGDVEPSLAGPRRPQDRVSLQGVRGSFVESFQKELAQQAQKPGARSQVPVQFNGHQATVGNGSVVIAAITSCTNTSNPSVMVGAGLLAKKAAERGLASKPWVKTSTAPGSQVVTDYLDAAGLTPYLDRLGFNTVGYGCTTCIGNSGPLPEPVSQAINQNDLVVAAVISGNRNFEGRVHPEVRANYLASPMLVVAYALAGTVEIDLTQEPLGQDPSGAPVYLRDVWPTQQEIGQTIARSLSPDMYRARYARVSEGSAEWRSLPVPEGDLYAWDPESTYIQEVPFFQYLESAEPADILGARVLVKLGDSITTDHISPAGSIPAARPGGQYLISQGVQPVDFNTYGARRGNHEVMMRGTFGNVRLRNHLTPDKEGDWTLYFPSPLVGEGQGEDTPGDEVTSIYEAAMKYQQAGIPTIVLAGKEYGSGSSRDWAAKGPNLLGVKAVIAESYERLPRSNLVGMAVLPLQFKPGESAATLGLAGREAFDVLGLAGSLEPGQDVGVRATRSDGSSISFTVRLRIDTRVEVDYYRRGGVLQAVLHRILQESQTPRVRTPGR